MAKALECRERDKKPIAEQHHVLNRIWPPGRGDIKAGDSVLW